MNLLVTKVTGRNKYLFLLSLSGTDETVDKYLVQNSAMRRRTSDVFNDNETHPPQQPPPWTMPTVYGTAVKTITAYAYRCSSRELVRTCHLMGYACCF